jgi:hypothetical protein
MSERWFLEFRLAWIKESVEIFGQINRENVMRKIWHLDRPDGARLRGR